MPYFESRLKIDTADQRATIEKLELCKKLKIKNLIVELNNAPMAILNERIKVLEGYKPPNINLFYRVNLNINNLKVYRKVIKQYNKFPYIVSLTSKEKKIQIAGAKDTRVDILSFSESEVLKTLSKGIISLVKQDEAFLEFSLSPIFNTNRRNQSKNIRNLYRYINLAKNNKVKFLISGNFDNPYDLRNPRTLMSVCHTFFNLPLSYSKKIFKEYPKELIKRTRQRIDKRYIKSGIKLIERGY
ncbi:MAG: hypothetical protein GF353_26880 [Candidatus Lokiarchaeota archaeon]|nr:hypothetical protein [Candidatus Lokiarchaeota archaeon]